MEKTTELTEKEKYIIEIRWKPSALMLDKRGAVATELMDSFFHKWLISANQINLSSDKNPDVTASLSYRNLSVVSETPNDVNFFVSTAESFIKKSWPHFPNDKLTRIGVRSLVYSPSEDFPTLLKDYKSALLKLDDSKFRLFGGDLIDIGLPLNFKKDDINFNVVTGPMKREQARGFYAKDEGLPGVGIFIDVDYFQTEHLGTFRRPHDINVFLNRAINKAKEIHTVIHDIISSAETA